MTNESDQENPQHEHADTLGQKTVWNIVATVANIGSSIIAAIVVARMLGPKGVGAVGYLIWLATFLASVFSLGLPFAITKFLAEYIGRRDQTAWPTLTRWISRMTVACLMVGGVLVALASLLPSAASYLGALRGGWLVTYLSFTGLAGLYQGYLAGSQQFRLAAKLSAASAVLQVVIVSAGTRMFGEGGAVVGYLAFLALPAVGALTLLIPRPSGRNHALPPELRRRVMRYSIQTWLAALMGAIVWTRAELFFLERYFSKEVVGYFTVALSMAALASQVPVLLSGALLPHMAQRLGEGDIETVQALYASATRILAFVAFPLAAMMAGSASVLVPLMYGRQFEPAIGTAVVLVCVAAIGATASAGSALVYAAERSSFILLCGVVGSAAVVASGVTIVRQFGAPGAAGSRAVIQVLMVVWGMWYIARRLHYKPPILSMLKTALAAGTCAAAAWTVTFFWHSPLAIVPAVVAAGGVYAAAALLIRPLEPADMQALWQVASRSGRLFR